MIKNYLEPFYQGDEKERQERLYDEILVNDERLTELSDKQRDTVSQIRSLEKSDLEIGETEQERQSRLQKLSVSLQENSDQIESLNKQLKISIYEANAIELTVRSRYLEQTDDSMILQNCLELIDGLEKDDVMVNAMSVLAMFDGLGGKDYPRNVIKFSYIVRYRIIDWYLDYFTDSKSLFKIMKRIYDKSRELFPGELTDQDRENKYCIFDKAFFKALSDFQKKREHLDYEIEVLQDYKKESPGHIIPTSVKISDTNYALGTVGSRHQMTIDEYLKLNEANDLVTFKGLDDDGLQFVFNENIKSKDTIQVTFKNLETASGGGTAPSKVFVMILEKMNDLGYFHHKVVNVAVTISVKNLIESGAFSSRSKAKTALENAEKTLKNVMINFKQKDKGLNVDSLWFSSIGWKDSTTILVMPNKDINWRAIGSHFAIYPPYIYRLKTHAYKLAYYIFTQARINKEVNQDGDIKFNLRLISVGRELGLPSVDSVSNYDIKKLILNKIISAMKELTDTDKDYYGESRLVLKIKSEKDVSTREIIENGNLVVTIQKGELTEVYQKIRERKVDLIEAQKQKDQAIKRKAKGQSSGKK